MKCAVLVGRSLWLPGAVDVNDGTTAVCETPEAAAKAIAGFAVENKLGRLALLAEPAGMEHLVIDAPRTDRATFVQLAQSEHSVVQSDTIGWGFQTAWPVGSGAVYRTILHSETVPGLLDIRQRLEDDSPKTRLIAAWPWFTAAERMIGPTRGGIPVAALLVAEQGLTLAVLAPLSIRRSTTWASADPRAWEELRGQLMDLGAQLADDNEPRRRSKPRLIICGLGVNVEIACPYWGGLHRSAVVEVCKPDLLVARLEKIKPGHTSNLLDAFPRPFDLNPLLWASSAIGLIGIVGGLWWAQVIESRNARQAALAEQAAAQAKAQIDRLAGNGRELARLREDYSEQLAELPSGRHAALQMLANLTPAAITLTGFSLNEEGVFRLEGLIVDDTYLDTTGFRTDLNRAGFSTATEGGWVGNSGPKRGFLATGVWQHSAPRAREARP